MTYHKGFYEKITFLKRVYTSNTNRTSPNYLTLRKWSKRGAFFVKYGIALILSTSATFVGWAVVSTLWTGEHEIIVYFMLPGLDPKEVFDYTVLCIYHLSALLLGTFGTCNCDFTLVVLVFHLWPLTDILDTMCNELNAVLTEESNRNTKEQREFFYNLVKIHIEISEYLEDLSEIYFAMLFVECYTCAFALCTLLYSMSTVKPKYNFSISI